MKKFYFLLFLLMVCCNTFSQTFAQNTTSRNSTWIANSESPKAFIENKGQFAYSSCTDIKFAVDEGHTLIYFTPNGLTYYFRKKENAKKDEEEMGREAKKKKNMTAQEWAEFEREEKRVKIETDVVSMQWENANPNVEIVTQEKAEGYRSYSFYEGKHVKNINHINGFKKIVYKNLYPNIDVEYIFHPQGGIKYSLILHSGADASQVKMKYSGTKKISSNAQGEIHIATKFGDIIDHAPTTFYSADKSEFISSKFIVNGRTVSFSLGNYDHSHTIVIDPWTQTPTLPNSNAVWECEKDGAGNVYIIGGDAPMKLQKYTSAGVFVWTYNTPWDTVNNWLGTIATDLAGNSYITSGSTAAMQKVNTNAGMVWDTTGSGYDEYWSIAFNCDQSKLIVGGTRLNPSTIANSFGIVFEIDTSNGSIINTKNVSNTRTDSIFSFTVTDIEEVRAISSSRNAKYYFLTLDTIGAIDQNLSLNPVFIKNHSYSFGYKSENFRPQNGNSGICAIKANQNFVYTQNGSTVDKRSLLTGAVLASAAIPGGISNLNASTSPVHYQPGNSGIAIDSCGNVYVGSGNAVIKYDADLNFITSASTSFSVFDVEINYNGEVIVCGATGNSSSASRTGYVQSINMSSCMPIASGCDTTLIICPSFNLATFTTSVCGNTAGTATVTVNGGISPFTYNWSNGQTTATATGLAAGVYTITVIDNVPCTDSVTVVVEETGNPPIASVTSSVDSVCEVFPPGNTSVVLNATGGDQYLWSTGDTTSIITGYLGWTDSTFYVTVTNACGSSVDSITIYVVDSNLSLNVTTADAHCDSCDGTVTVNASGGIGGYSFSWSNGQTGQTVTGLCSGTYNVTVQNSCGSDSATAIIYNATLSSLIMSATPDSGNTDGTATASPSDGTPPYSFQWSANTNNQTTATITGLAAGTYYVTVTDTFNCTVIDSVMVDSYSGLNEKNTSGEKIYIYPNPAKNEIKVFLSEKNIFSLKIYVFNVWGEELIRLDNNQTAGKTSIPIQISTFSSGVYFVSVHLNNNPPNKIHFVKE